MLWPRMVTSGANHMVVHIIAMTPPTANQGVVFNGMDGALLFIRSTDGGTTWVKTIIYNSPYNLTGTNQSSPGWFYCPDGTSSIALDNNGMAHVTFALGCDSIDVLGNGYHQRWTNGIVYWNESMPMLRQDLKPDSLFLSNQFIGWVTDTIVFHQPSGIRVGDYHGAIPGTPSMAIDASQFVPGIYFYTVYLDEYRLTKRLVVD